MMFNEFYLYKFIIISPVNIVNIYLNLLETENFYLFLSVYNHSNNSLLLRE